MAGRIARLVAVAVGALTIGLGVWALADPLSFYEQLATYPPYNRHLFHDVGAFQTGIGGTLVLAAFARDPLFLGLVGASIGTVLHAISHVMDRDLGGRTSDPWLLGLLGLVVVAAALLRANELARRSADRTG